MKKEGRKSVSEQLRALTISEDVANIEKVYRKKKKKQFLILVLAVSLVTVGLVFSVSNSREKVVRPEYGMAEKDYEVVAEDSSGKTKINIEVQPKKLSDKEVADILEQNEKDLPKLILGSNTDADHVEQNLNLVTQVGDYATEVHWYIEGQNVLDYNGKINWKEVGEDQLELLLKAEISLLGQSKDVQIPVRLIKSKKEKIRQALEEAVNADDAKKMEDVILPSKVEDAKILMDSGSFPKAMLIIILAVMLVLFIYNKLDEPLNKAYLARNRQLLMDYPDLVGKFTLYMGAGCSVMQTFRKMVQQYERSYCKDGVRRYAYEEMRMALQKIENGTDQAEAYISMGNRCKEACYIKFGNMLAQNLKKGNERICLLLQEMVVLGYEERKERIIKESEQAGTKLLFPMSLMLIVVVAVVVIPAFMNIGF